MTDDEIIKVLECCSKPYCNNNKCPLHRNTINTKDCITQMSVNALDLINRKNAEIERLQGCVKSEDEVRAIATETIKTGIKTIKAEAIKEFAKRLKEKERPVFPLAMVIDVYEIDNLVKEMVGADI